MFGFSGKQFKDDLETFVKTNGASVVSKASILMDKGLQKLKEEVFPSMKPYRKTATIDGKYQFIINMPGIKKLDANVTLKNSELLVKGSTNDNTIHFTKNIGKDEIDSVKLEDGLMTITIKEAPETKTFTVD